MKYTVTHTCGHEEVHNLVGPFKAREARLASEQTSPCTTCSRANTLAHALEYAAKNNLPALEGTPKQIEWAESIRFKLLASIQINHPEAYKRLSAKTGAKFWIDNRFKYGDLVNMGEDEEE